MTSDLGMAWLLLDGSLEKEQSRAGTVSLIGRAFQKEETRLNKAPMGHVDPCHAHVHSKLYDSNCGGWDRYSGEDMTSSVIIKIIITIILLLFTL